MITRYPNQDEAEKLAKEFMRRTSGGYHLGMPILDFSREQPMIDDIEKVHTALALFASCIKSGEAWSPTCERVQREAHEALVRIADVTLKDDKDGDKATDPLHRK